MNKFIHISCLSLLFFWCNITPAQPPTTNGHFSKKRIYISGENLGLDKLIKPENLRKEETVDCNVSVEITDTISMFHFVDSTFNQVHDTIEQVFDSKYTNTTLRSLFFKATTKEGKPGIYYVFYHQEEMIGVGLPIHFIGKDERTGLMLWMNKEIVL